jgi:hypothetical protein
MHPRLSTFFLIVLTLSILVFHGLPSGADTIFLQSGASVRGQIIGFDGSQYRVVIEGETFNYDAEEIRGFNIDRDPAASSETPQQQQQQQQNLQPIYQQLSLINAKLDNFMEQYQSSASEMQQKLYSLNPISQVRVLEQDGAFDRDGTYKVTGRLINESNEFVRYYNIQATLYDTNGNEVQTKQVTPRVPNIGPGATARFEVTFQNPPGQVGSVEVVPYLSTRSSDQDIGGYQMQSPAVNRYRNR